MRKVLYVQHASTLGGSCVSLLYTIQNLDRNIYNPILALSNKDQKVVRYYNDAGVKPLLCPGLTFWNHTTAISRPIYKPSTWIDLAKTIWSWKNNKKILSELVSVIEPDLIHLNSVVLSASAADLHRMNIPFVWHIREHPPKSLFGIRSAIIRHLMHTCPNELVFISEADRQAWVGGVRGKVIHNFVDFTKFDRNIDGQSVRKKMGIEVDATVVLYLGGLNKIKGIFPLINSLSFLKHRLPKIRCLMPGSEYNPPDYWQLNTARKILPLLGSGTVGQRAIQSIKRSGLNEVCIRLPFQEDIEKLFAASDLLVFPSTTPHFARPIIEASAMAIPVVASRFSVMEELVQNGRSGTLVEPNNPEHLADAIYDIMTNKEKARQMGDAGYVYAREHFSAKHCCENIMLIYENLLNKKG